MGVSARFAALALVLALPARAAELPPPGAASCSGCHPASAGVDTPVASLAGMKAADIAAAMRAYRSGEKPGTIMGRVAKGFDAGEIDALAAWWAARKP
jgi:cytochrome c553